MRTESLSIVLALSAVVVYTSTTLGALEHELSKKPTNKQAAKYIPFISFCFIREEDISPSSRNIE